MLITGNPLERLQRQRALTTKKQSYSKVAQYTGILRESDRLLASMGWLVLYMPWERPENLMQCPAEA